jgi:hypothetical protein
MINEHKKGVKAMKYTTKPRNFVAKNMTTSGAGAHKDKKKAAKQGETKHKKKEVTETSDRKLAIMLEMAVLSEQIKEAIDYRKKNRMIRAIAGSQSGKELGLGISELSLSSDDEIIQMYKDYVDRNYGSGASNGAPPVAAKKVTTKIQGKDKLTKMLSKLSQPQLVGYYKNLYTQVNGEEPDLGQDPSSMKPNWLIQSIQSMASQYMPKKHQSYNIAEGWTHDSLAAELFETPSYENHLQELLDGKLAFMEGGTEERVTMASKKPGSHQHLNDSDQGNIDDMGLASVHPSEKGDEDEYGMEGEYLRNELHTIMRVCKHLEHALDDDEDLPTWVIDKMSQAKGMIVSVMDYLISEKEETLDKKSGKEDHMMK